MIGPQDSLAVAQQNNTKLTRYIGRGFCKVGWKLSTSPRTQRCLIWAASTISRQSCSSTNRIR